MKGYHLLWTGEHLHTDGAGSPRPHCLFFKLFLLKSAYWISASRRPALRCRSHTVYILERIWYSWMDHVNRPIESVYQVSVGRSSVIFYIKGSVCVSLSLCMKRQFSRSASVLQLPAWISRIWSHRLQQRRDRMEVMGKCEYIISAFKTYNEVSALCFSPLISHRAGMVWDIEVRRSDAGLY